MNVLAPAFSSLRMTFSLFPVFRLHHEEKDEYPGVHLIKLLPSSLTLKSNKLESLSTMSSNSGNSDKHSSLLRTLINYGRKKFNEIVSRTRIQQSIDVSFWRQSQVSHPEAVFLVVCDPSMNEL